MPHFLRISNRVIHIPSLSSVTISSSYFDYPFLTLTYHDTRHTIYIYYGNWKDCEKDLNQIKNALSEVERLLSQVPLTEAEVKGEAKNEIVVQVETINKEQ